MANHNSNFPSNQLNNLPENFCTDTVRSLRELNALGKPTNIEELKQRIDHYFLFCEQNDFRCGVESLCLALGVSRQTLWNWCNSNGCDEQWAEVCRSAKQFILTFLEQLTLKNKINPASSIFYLKNWGTYRDNISFDEAIPQTSVSKALPASMLPKLGDIKQDLFVYDEQKLKN